MKEQSKKRTKKKVVYFNFDLLNPSDLKYYELLERLGRTKKQVLRMLLENAGMLEPVVKQKKPKKEITNENQVPILSVVPIEGLVTEEKPEKKQETAETLVPTMKKEPDILPVQVSVPTPVIQIDNEAEEKEDNPYSMLTEEQDVNDISDEEAAMLSQLGNIFQSMQS